ncbi:MAG: hypothetical protein AAFU77_10215 [Myxococcota bacterium]
MLFVFGLVTGLAGGVLLTAVRLKRLSRAPVTVSKSPFEKRLDDLQLAGFSREEGGHMRQIRSDLDRNLQIADRVENRMRELESALGGDPVAPTVSEPTP